jgi:Zn-dependent protease
VLLILVHELGHSIAMLRYGLKASPPIFIPFVGALINLRERPKDALQESVVGIAGPAAGTVGAIACYFYYLKTGNELALDLAYFGFLLNLFNMLPVPPLDGGRITAAISPLIWMPGLLIVVGWVVYTWIMTRHINYMLVLLLFFAWPRVRRTLFGNERQGEYYQIGRPATWAMGIAYVGLGLSLLILFMLARRAHPGGIF